LWVRRKGKVLEQLDEELAGSGKTASQLVGGTAGPGPGAVVRILPDRDRNGRSGSAREVLENLP
jgi:hypothetical protein